MTERSDRAVNMILVAVLVVTCGTLLIAAIALPVLFDSRDSVRAQQKSDEIAGCRSSYRVELYDGPQFRALQALALGDDEALRIAALDADPDRYEALVVLSRTNPDRFLAQCRQDEPGE